MSSQTHADQDTLFLERVLDQLYDFGSAPKKKLNPQKKKKRKRHEEEDELPAEKNTCEDTRAENPGPEDQKQPKNEQTGPNVRSLNQVEVVTFKDPAKKLKSSQTPANSNTPVPPLKAPQITQKEQSERPEELSLEKARLEVHRFGLTGYKKEQQRVFEQDRAVMLGARPPKKDHVNYKLLQAQIKDKKEKEKEEVQSGDKKKKKKKKKQSKQKDQKKSSSDSSMAASGQVGRFKNGMLILSPKEIQKIKKGQK